MLPVAWLAFVLYRGWAFPGSSVPTFPFLMPSHSPAELAAQPAQRSVVLVQPTGLLVAMALLLGSLLLLINTLKLADSPTPERKVAGALLGLGLLLGAGYRRARQSAPAAALRPRGAAPRGPRPDAVRGEVERPAARPARLPAGGPGSLLPRSRRPPLSVVAAGLHPGQRSALPAGLLLRGRPQCPDLRPAAATRLVMGPASRPAAL